MKFNLGGEIASESKAGKSTRLKANAIHDVIFDGVVAETITKKDGSESFNVLKLKFKNDEGLTYEDTIFEPREQDGVRQANNFGYENPSNVEELQFKVKHLLSAVAPDVAKKMDSKADGVVIDGWEGLRQFIVKNTAKAIGTRTQIKLLSDKDNNPRFPGFVLGITKAGQPYPKTNFIGAKLAFTAKEEERIEKAASATPTRMPSKSNDDSLDLSVGVAGDGDLDLDLDLA